MMNGCAVGPYKRGIDPLWSHVDLNGLQCDDTCWLWVLENEVPYIPAPVYHTSTGTKWQNPIQYLANGVLPVNIFWEPGRVYRLEIRRTVGNVPPSQNDPLLYFVENYIPFDDSGGGPGDVSSSPTDNQILNPQFSIVNFSEPFNRGLNNPDPIELAPGWFLDLVGNGNLILERVALTAGIQNPTNAPYALRISLGGAWTQAVLRQTFSQNGNTWANKFVSSSITARIAGAPQNITLTLDASNGAQLALLQTPMLGNDLMEFTSVTQMPVAANPDTPPDASINLKIGLPLNGDVYLTSIQLIASETNTQFSYEQDTIERQESNLFSYYKEKLETKPIASYLVGWDFALNPAQFEPTTTGPNVWGPYASGSNSSNYVWDQTIVFQSSDQGFEVERSNVGDFRLTSAANNSRLALVQYLEIPPAIDILSGLFAVNIACKKTFGQNRRGIIQIYYTTDPNLPGMGANNSLIDTLNADGSVSAFHGNWNEVSRANLGPGYFSVSGATAQERYHDTMISGFSVPPSVDLSTVTHLAIVVGFEEMGANESLDIQSISLCSGDIATRPAPKTLGQTLLDCERYYKMSYGPDLYAGSVDATSALIKDMDCNIPHDPGVGTYLSGAYATPFNIDFNVPQRSSAQNVTVYSTDGTINTVRYMVSGQSSLGGNANISNWTLTQSSKRLTFIPANQTVFVSQPSVNTYTPCIGYIRFHYVSDARLGIV